jgi:hypothetical protein
VTRLLVRAFRESMRTFPSVFGMRNNHAIAIITATKTAKHI